MTFATQSGDKQTSPEHAKIDANDPERALLKYEDHPAGFPAAAFSLLTVGQDYSNNCPLLRHR